MSSRVTTYIYTLWTNSSLTLIHLSLGSAVEALPHMNSLLNARPDGFDSVEEAIEWQ